MYEIYCQVRDSLGLKDADVVRLSGVSKSTFSDWKSGRSTPKKEKLIKIASALNISLDYLMTGNSSNNNEAKGARIPVLGYVAAGLPIDAIEEILDYEEIPAKLASTGKFFGLKIKGHSMEPSITDGDTVIVRSQKTAESGDVVIVQVNGDEATCKQLVITDNGINLISFNSLNYPPMVFTAKQVRDMPVQIIGKVVELRRSF